MADRYMVKLQFPLEASGERCGWGLGEGDSWWHLLPKQEQTLKDLTQVVCVTYQDSQDFSLQNWKPNFSGILIYSQNEE